MATARMFRFCLLLTALAVLLLTTGCAGFSRYMKDRGNDFLDCFNLQAGWGLIADAEVRVTDYISTGAACLLLPSSGSSRGRTRKRP
jgi:hypothetical protein